MHGLKNVLPTVDQLTVATPNNTVMKVENFPSLKILAVFILIQ